MDSKLQVAAYTATLTRELCRMCRKAGLTDVAYLLEVAAAEASKDQVVRRRNGQNTGDRVLNGARTEPFPRPLSF
jgi:hypothetical protein